MKQAVRKSKLTAILCLSLALSCKGLADGVQPHAPPDSAAGTMQRLLIETPPTDVQTLEVISFKAIQGHHFNLEAPQHCGSSEPVDKTARTIECQFTSGGSASVTLSICDDAKTFCKPESFNIQVLPTRSTAFKRLKPLGSASTPSTAEHLKELGLGMMSFTAAQDEALRSKKNMLVLISTQWCPPCNDLKELTLRHRDFKDITDKYVRVYLDGDTAHGSDWNGKIEIYGYPSLVVLDSKGREIDRNVGFADVDELRGFLASTQGREPIDAVGRRIEKRKSGAVSQRITDFFWSKESKTDDSMRYARWLNKVHRSSEIPEVLDGISGKDADMLRFAAAIERLSARDAAQLSETERQEFIRAFTSSIREGSPLVSPYDFGFLCEVNRETCRGFVTDLKRYIETEEAKPRQQVYKQYASVYGALDLARMYETLEQKDQAQFQYRRCAQEAANLITGASLKEGRGLQLLRASCLAHGNDTPAAESVLRAMIAQYPYESTFYFSLARVLREQKRTDAALEAARQAEQYGFGTNWARAALLKAELEIEIGKKSEASATLALLKSEIRPTSKVASWQQGTYSKIRDFERKLAASQSTQKIAGGGGKKAPKPAPLSRQQ